MVDCNYMKTKYNYTPSDYDIYFDVTDIPKNIDIGSSVGLEDLLTVYTPLTRKLHLNLSTMDKDLSNEYEVCTGLEIDGEVIF